jgi:transposase, IS5 family
MVGGRVHQATLWSFIQRDGDLPPGLQEVRVFLDVLAECDEEIVFALGLRRGPRGRDDHPVLAMWQMFAVQLFLRNGLFKDLLAEVGRNTAFARMLGFKELLPGKFDLPSASAVTRMYTTLQSDPYASMVKRVQEKTVGFAHDEDSEIGKHTATDTSDVRTHGHPIRHEGDPEKEKPATDPEASWSVKTKRWQGKDGKKREETKSTFGFKACLNVDVKHPVVIEVETVTGSTNDQGLSTPLLEGAVRILGPGVMETCAEDKGFDSNENVKTAYRDLGVSLLVPVRDVPENLESLPPQDREVALEPGGNVVRDVYSGEVACYERTAGGQVIRREMKYAGFEDAREEHKFRCPLGAAAGTSCSSFSRCSAGTCGKQGRQVRVELKTDFRRFAPVYPRSKKWKRLYNGRTAVERVNSYLKEVLRLERHCLRGLKAINLRITLAAITLNIRTIILLRAANRAKAEQKAAA